MLIGGKPRMRVKCQWRVSGKGRCGQELVMRVREPGMRVRGSGERVMRARASDESMRGREPLMRVQEPEMASSS